MSCPDCISGGVHDGQPTGTTATLHGIPTYIAQPEAGIKVKGLIVMITDGFGWEFVNNRLLCDQYAKNGGFLVYCPDFMMGSAMSPVCLPLVDKITVPASWYETLFKKPIYVIQALIHVIPWLIKTRMSVVKPRVFNFFKALRTSPPPFETNNLKVGAAGFCWGGAYTFLLAHDTPSSRVQRHVSQTKSTALEPLLDCAFAAHPSSLKVPTDIEAVKIPMSVAVGDNDMAMNGEQALQMKKILEDKLEGDHVVNILPGAKHGFSIRAIPDDKLQMEYADQAEAQAIAWFTRWFGI